MGFCLAPNPIRHWLVLAKQGVDLHTSTFNQALAAEYLSGGHLKQHLPRIIALYRPRQQAMLAAMADEETLTHAIKILGDVLSDALIY